VKRTIPEIRVRLLEIAEELADTHAYLEEELREIVSEMIRRSPARKRAPTKMKPIAELNEKEVRRFAFNNPHVHVSEIASMYGTNPGRISEILNS
jgi:hypothetical protein